MKVKRITFLFDHPLDKVITYQGHQVTQEEIFFTDVEGIREKVRKDLKGVLGKLNLLRFINPGMVQMMEARIQGIDIAFEWMVEFKKVEPTKYTFTYPMDATALLTIKNLGLKLGFIKLKERDLHLAQILREKELMAAFEKFTFKEMGLTPTEYDMSVEELETEPTPSP